MNDSDRQTITLEPPWWRCENGNEFRCGPKRPDRCPVCGSTNIEMVPEIMGELSNVNEPTAVADGRYCVHHDDDPAHGPACYEADSTWNSGEAGLSD